jgi:phospholipase/carboxylesterase
MNGQLETQEIESRGAARGSVIWMHGLGATNHDFDDVVPMLETPWLRYVFPQAPDLPVTINGGMLMPAWYDILSFSDPPLREDEPTLRASALRVEKLIAREIERGVPSERIILMGFSQGGAMALHVGNRYPSSLCGIAVLSGYLLLPDRFLEERHPSNAQTPTLFCHGTYDPVVPFALGRRAHETLAQHSPNVEFHSFPMQHSLCMPEIDVLRAWLLHRFAE